MVYILLLSVSLFVHKAHGYGGGAPTRQCDRMYPGHGVTAQAGPSPYTIELSQNTFGCSSDEITVTLRGRSPFKGFLCQPRPNPEVYEISGILASDGQDGVPKQDKCGGAHSLTHTSSKNKTNLVFKWRPTTAVNVYIVCTVVENYKTFWVKLRSDVIAYVSRDCVRIPTTSGSGTNGGASSSGGTNTGAGGTSTGTGDTGNTGTASGGNTQTEPETKSETQTMPTNGSQTPGTDIKTNSGGNATNVDNTNGTGNPSYTDGGGKNRGDNLTPCVFYLLTSVLAVMSLFY